MPPASSRFTSTPLGRFGKTMLRRGQRAFRLSLYLAVVFTLVSWFGLRSVQGSIGEAALSLGRQLERFDDERRSSERVRLNGELVNFASSVVSEPIGQVLDRFERACRSGSIFPPELANAAAEAAVGPLGSAPRAGVLRKESSTEGLVACIVRAPGTQDSLAARLARFDETLDLGDVGLLRYAYAKKTANGRTHLISVYTDGPFRLAALLGDGQRDAPGSDLSHGARPIDSVRLLSAHIEAAPHSSRIYGSKSAPGKVLATLDRDMRRLGWKTIPVSDVEKSGRGYVRRGVDVLVFAYPSAEGSVVSMVESSSR